MMLQKWLVRGVLPVLVAAAIYGGWEYRQHVRFKHFAVHEPGMVYRAAWLDPEPLGKIIEKHQIRAVVNLCTPGEMGGERWEQERHAVTNAGAKLIELEMPVTVNADDPAIARHLDVLKNPNNYPLLVHCQHGVTRTAKFLAIYDIAFRDKSAQESLAAQPLFGREDHNVHVRAFVQSFEKEHKKLYPSATSGSLDVLRR